ncbi:MAG: SPASM domain-containing protein [Selenomonadaceae bacterium]|nr:SPASM domain-containing protein [Selenomonadaceae bacterium]
MSVAYMNEEFAYYHNLWNEKKREGKEKFSSGAPLSKCISTVSLMLSDTFSGKKRYMSFENIKKTVKDLQAINYDGAVSLSLYGEPFDGSNVFEIAEYIKDELLNASVFLYTNGLYVNESAKDNINETIDLLTVKVSDERELERIRNLDIKTGLYAFVENSDEGVIKYIQKDGCSSVPMPCSSFIDKVVVSPVGEICLCEFHQGQNCNIGNIFEKMSFEKVIDSPKIRNIQGELLSGNRELFDVCKVCV